MSIKLGTGFVVGLLEVLRMILYIISAPFAVVMTIFGSYFIVIGFAWIVLVDAAFISAILIFTANFYMAFVALFVPSFWGTMGGMWSWLWGWFASGNLALWPHFVRSFPPYLIAGAVFMVLINFAEYHKAVAIKVMYKNS